MRKVTVEKPVVVYQGTDQPIMHGGNQDPFIRCKNGILYVKFNKRRDAYDTFGMDDKNPVYRSTDEGKTWEKSTYVEWVKADSELPNGDIFSFTEHSAITEFPELPSLPNNRNKTKISATASVEIGDVYTVEELEPILGDKVSKVFYADRIKAGTDEIVREACSVHWDNMPVMLCDRGEKYLKRVNPTCRYKVDKDGVMWLPVHSGAVADDGSLMSERISTHILKSEDFGHNWHYVSTIPYKEEYQAGEYGLEGFDEATIEFTDDGMIVIIRSGSLYPGCWVPKKETDSIPTPYIAKSTDGGKTWDSIKPFYKYGIRPQSVKLGCGTIIMTSGRPGVYVRTCDDPLGENWNDVINILSVPEENLDTEYYEYSCSNNDICAYDENTAFLVYSNFRLDTPEGERAKSILVSKITIE